MFGLDIPSLLQSSRLLRAHESPPGDTLSYLESRLVKWFQVTPRPIVQAFYRST